MENAMAIAAVLGPVWVVMGLSFLLYAKQWQKLLDKFEKDHLVLFPLMLVYLVVGLILVRMYNVWEWNLWLIVTLVGWVVFLKGALYMLLPGSLIKWSLGLRKHNWLMYLCGLVVLVLGAVLSYYVYYV